MGSGLALAVNITAAGLAGIHQTVGVVLQACTHIHS